MLSELGLFKHVDAIAWPENAQLTQKCRASPESSGQDASSFSNQSDHDGPRTRRTREESAATLSRAPIGIAISSGPAVRRHLLETGNVRTGPPFLVPMRLIRVIVSKSENVALVSASR